MSDAGPTGDGGERKRVGEIPVTDSTLNRVLDVLAGQRRRYTVAILRQADTDVVELADLAGALLTQDPSASNYDRVQRRLHHHTLPHLADASIVDYDARANTVRYQGDDVLEDLLDCLPIHLQK